MRFCPVCANILLVTRGAESLQFYCHTCPYVYDITQTVSSVVKLQRKQVDDVLGGASAWENVDATEGAHNCLFTCFLQALLYISFFAY